jgi:hypothetical protein
MFKLGGNVPLDDPVQRLCEQVEDVGSGLYAKDEDDGVVKGFLPDEAKEWPVSRTYRDVVECFFEVKFG